MSEQSALLQATPHGSGLLLRFLVPRLTEDDIVRRIGDEVLHLQETAVPKMTINMSGVEMVSSSMLGQLISAQRRARIKQGFFALCCVTPEVRQILEISRLDSYFDIYPTLEEALVQMG